jgi:hypothetical protein
VGASAGREASCGERLRLINHVVYGVERVYGVEGMQKAPRSSIENRDAWMYWEGLSYYFFADLTTRGGKLLIVEFGIKAVQCEEFLMGASLNNLAFIHNQDYIGSQDR